MNNGTEQLIQEALRAASDNDKAKARQYIAKALKQNPQNARAWYILSQVVDEPERAVYCLHQVLKIQPDHNLAMERLRKLENKPPVFSKSKPREDDVWARKNSSTRNFIIIAAGIVLSVCFIVGAGYWYYYYGPCGRIRLANSREEIVGILEKISTKLGEMNFENSNSVLAGINAIQTEKNNLESIRVPSCMAPFKGCTVEVAQEYLNILQLNIEISNLMGKGVDENDLYGSAVRLDLIREKMNKGNEMMDKGKRLMDLCTEKARQIDSCAPWCP
jgi:hypothetical protein